MIENEEVEEIFLILEDKLEKTVSVMQEEFSTIRAGRANPHVLDKIQVEAYGGMSALNTLGNISALDARCLVVSPWDKSLLKSIEKAILSANIGLTPTNDGNQDKTTATIGGWLYVLDTHPHIPDYDPASQETETETCQVPHKHKLIIKPWLPNVNDTVVCLYLPAFNADGIVLGAISS